MDRLVRCLSGIFFLRRCVSLYVIIGLLQLSCIRAQSGDVTVGDDATVEESQVFFHLHPPPRPSPCHHYDESLIKVRSLRPATKARPLHQETITTMRFHISHRSHPGSQVPLSPMAVGEPD